MKNYDKLYIDGSWVAPAGSDTLEVIDSTTEEVFATIPAGVPADIDRAVAAAKAAFPAWSEEPAPERGKLLLPRRRGARGPTRRDRRRHHARGRHAQGVSRPRSRWAPGSRRSRPRPSSRRRSSSRTRSNGPRRPRADRRRRLHHAVELPAQPDRRQGRVRVGRRLHRRAEAVGGRAGQRVHPRRDHRRHRVPARGVQSRHRRRARSSARRWPRIPTSTWCRSPAPPAPAGGCPSSRHRRSRGSHWSSAASRRTCSSTTPTSRRRSPRASAPRTRTRARPAARSRA